MIKKTDGLKHPDGKLSPKMIITGNRRNALMLRAIQRWQDIRAAILKKSAA
jgi:hypothetical protein